MPLWRGSRGVGGSSYSVSYYFLHTCIVSAAALPLHCDIVPPFPGYVLGEFATAGAIFLNLERRSSVNTGISSTSYLIHI